MTLDESKRIQRGMAIKELRDRGNMVIFREKNPLSKESDRELLDILTEEYDVEIDMKGASFDENGFILNQEKPESGVLTTRSRANGKLGTPGTQMLNQ